MPFEKGRSEGAWYWRLPEPKTAIQTHRLRIKPYELWRVERLVLTGRLPTPEEIALYQAVCREFADNEV